MSNEQASSLSEDAAAQVKGLVARARAAQAEYERFGQDRIDEVVTALGWALVDPMNNRALSELAVQETGLGNVEDKAAKNRRKTMGLLRDLRSARTVGVIAEHPEKGLVEIARPAGVVGAVVPSTNPVATAFNKAINALKCGNAIILAPSPSSERVCARVVESIGTALARVGAPLDLVQMLSPPVSKAATYDLMRQVDLVVATGSASNVKAAYESGTPAVGVGPGNVPVIVSQTADIADAAVKIAASKTFDNATSCSSENALVVLSGVYDSLLEALMGQGGVLLEAGEKTELQAAMWRDGRLNRRIVARSAPEICRVAGLRRPALQEARFLLVEEDGVGPAYPFSDEKLSPVLAVYKVTSFDEAFEIAHAILEHKGKGHSVGIYSHDDDEILRLGLEMPVCRIIVNQAHCFATGGSFDNGLPFSLSMGCGTWGGNSISDNLHYKHYLNITRISRSISPDEPTEEDLFGAFWEKYAIERR